MSLKFSPCFLLAAIWKEENTACIQILGSISPYNETLEFIVFLLILWGVVTENGGVSTPVAERYKVDVVEKLRVA